MTTGIVGDAPDYEKNTVVLLGIFGSSANLPFLRTNWQRLHPHPIAHEQQLSLPFDEASNPSQIHFAVETGAAAKLIPPAA